jgi:hypothetical protein
MKRAFLTLLILVAIPASAAEKWLEAYNRGVSLVRAGNFQAGAQALQHAVDEMPAENAAQRVRDQIFTYTPHFWLGIARLNLGDPDAALREWKVSEDQGAIQNTPYYAQLRDLIGRANSEKQRRAEGAATPSKQEANGAIGRALSAQMDAVTAGGDRSDTYHAAQRKLAEAKDANGKAGINVRAYERAAGLAEEARNLFATAADDAKKQRASRPKQNPAPARKAPAGDVAVPFEDVPQPKQTVQPRPQPQPPAPVAVPLTQPVAPKPAAEVKKPAPEPQPEPESEALIAARLAVQQYRRRLIAMELPVGDAQRFERELKSGAEPKKIRRVVEQLAAKERQLDARKPVEVAATTAAPDTTREQLEAAFRAFAAGDLASSDRALTQLLASKESAEGFLLRGCERYTGAMLTRDGTALLASATSDMQAALRLNRTLHLDRNSWSPKLIDFFEQVKRR